jgi:hypothetical protein
MNSVSTVVRSIGLQSLVGPLRFKLAFFQKLLQFFRFGFKILYTPTVIIISSARDVSFCAYACAPAWIMVERLSDSIM